MLLKGRGMIMKGILWDGGFNEDDECSWKEEG